MIKNNDPDKLYTASEVADMFRVDRRTVLAWARDGRLTGIRTPGGQWRFRADAVDASLIDRITSRNPSA